MKIVKPVSQQDTPDAFQHMSGCLKSFTNLLVKFLFWTGLGPIKIDEKTGTTDFKLFSVSSFLAFIRLFLFNFPVLVLPIILFVGGPMKKEQEDITGKSFTGLDTPIQSVGAIYQVEYCMGMLVYVLAFALPFALIKHIKELLRILREHPMMEKESRLINTKQVLFPILCFSLFALGKLMNLLHLLIKWDYPVFSIGKYCWACYLFFGHIPLHCLLAVYENFLYQEFSLFRALCSWVVNTENQNNSMITRAKVLPAAMEAIQGFGFFILVDVTLMLVYWLLHTYHAYFTFQVKTVISQNNQK